MGQSFYEFLEQDEYSAQSFKAPVMRPYASRARSWRDSASSRLLAYVVHPPDAAHHATDAGRLLLCVILTSFVRFISVPPLLFYCIYCNTKNGNYQAKTELNTIESYAVFRHGGIYSQILPPNASEYKVAEEKMSPADDIL